MIWKCAYGFLAIILAMTVGSAGAAEPEKSKGPPPFLVAAEAIQSGRIQPFQEMVGTVFYSRFSRVAAEVAGLVKEVGIEEGQRVGAGRSLVTLGTELLDTKIAETQASHGQALVELEQAQRNLERMSSLIRDKAISEALYDEHQFRVKGLEKKVENLAASLRRLELEREKMTIRSPFSGLIVKKLVEKGEWVDAGNAVAELADDSSIDVVVDVPQEMLRYLQQGCILEIKCGFLDLEGRFVSFVPQGDVATRTFAVKLRIKNTEHLIEGMEARAMLPAGPQVEGLLVSRDAVVDKSGRQMVFVADAGTAKMIPVKITGYAGLQVGIEGEGLTPGQLIITKGNERVRDGQPVRLDK